MLPGSVLLYGFVVNCLHFVASYVSFIIEEGFSNGLILLASIDGERGTMPNEDVLISKCNNFTEAGFKFFIIYCSRSNVQLATQNMSIIFVACICQRCTCRTCEGRLDLTLPCEGQFCTELR